MHACVALRKCPLLIVCHLQVAADMMQVCKFSHLEFGDPVPYHDLGRDKLGNGGYQTFIDESVATLLKVSSNM